MARAPSLTQLRTTAAEILFGLRADPLSQRVRRALRVGRQAGMLGDLATARLPAALRFGMRRGLSTRTVLGFQALLHPERIALQDDRRALSYAGADLEVNRLAHNLRDRLGVSRGDRVVLMMENRSEYVTAWLALFRLGVAAVHASYRLTAEELGHLVGDSGAKLIFASEHGVDAARGSLSRAGPDPPPRLVLTDEIPEPTRGEHLAFSELAGRGPEHFPDVGRGREEVASDNVVYTSGTTGRPKGAVRNFSSVGATEFLRIVERLPLQAGERHLVVAPMYHSAGQVFAMLTLVLGGTLYIRPRFDPEDTIRELSRHDIQSLFMVPTMVRRVVDLPSALHRRWPTPGLRMVISGAAAFPQALRERAIARFGPGALFDFYGATELGWVTLISGEEMLRRPGSVGRALPGQEIRILDEAGRPLARGETGAVYVRNAQTMVGYLNDRAATDEGRRGAWATVDDTGHLDEDGYLYLSGRSRDMVISGGVNIYPVEIEEVLAQHPAVGEVAVVGVPDPEWGESLVAAVVPASSDLDPNELRAFARGKLAAFKIPRRWEQLDELPRNATGKVLKRALRERFGGG